MKSISPPLSARMTMARRPAPPRVANPLCQSLSPTRE